MDWREEGCILHLPKDTSLSHVEVIDACVDPAQLTGAELATDSSKVHTSIVHFFTQDFTTEKKALPHFAQHNRRLDY